ncbi:MULTISPECIES: hypothetical protein [unclassified Streptomyces]|uniref:hypothetical protein n=1 Tax=unclassified Streptomyces TaxID=2593676 RepID=UPI00368DE652
MTSSTSSRTGRLADRGGLKIEGRRVIYTLADGYLRHVVDEALNLADHQLTNRPAHE